MDRSTEVEALVEAWFAAATRGDPSLPLPTHVYPRRRSRVADLHAEHERRIDVATHDELKRLAAALHTSVGNAVSLGVGRCAGPHGDE